MKALQCTELGGPEKLIVTEVPDPVIAEEHIIIEVKSASVNFPDVLMIQGLYQFQPPLPFTTGGESAGVITEIGDGVENFKVGDRVFAATGVGGISEKILSISKLFLYFSIKGSAVIRALDFGLETNMKSSND